MRAPPTLETERLTLRPLDDGDVDAVAEIFTFKEAMWDVLAIPGMPDDPHEVAKQRIADSKAGWRDHGAGFLAIALRDQGRVVGYCGFVNPSTGEADTAADGVLEVAWAVHPSYQRRGLASEAMALVIDYAFVDRDCARLVGITDPKNQASRAAMERLGFVFDADIHAYGVAQVRYVLVRNGYLARRSGCT